MDFSGGKKKAGASDRGFLDSFLAALVSSQLADSALTQPSRQSENVNDMRDPMELLHYNMEYEMSPIEQARGFLSSQGTVMPSEVENAKGLGLGPMLASLFNAASGRTNRQKATRINSATDNQIARASRKSGKTAEFDSYGINKILRGARPDL